MSSGTLAPRNRFAGSSPMEVSSSDRLWNSLWRRLFVLIPLLRLGVLVLTWQTGTAKWFFAQASELAVLAESIHAGHGMASPFGGNTGPTAFLTPGYPALVAAIFAVFGPLTLHSAIAITVVQALFSSATGVLLLIVGRRAFGTRVAVLAGAGWCLFPTLLFVPTFFWETSLSTLFVMSLLALAYRCEDRNDFTGWLSMGLTAAAALCVNPSLAPILATCFVWAIWQTRRGSRRPALSGLTVFLLLSLLWPVRNLHAMHAWIPLRSNMGYELWQGNRPGADGFFHVQFHPNTNAAELGRWQALGELGYMREKSTLAKASIASNPERFGELTLKRFACFWTGVSLTRNTVVIGEVSLTTLLGLWGAVLVLRRRRPDAALLIVPLLLFPLPYYVTHPDFRFRLVLEPLMLLLSAVAMTARQERVEPSAGSM